MGIERHKPEEIVTKLRQVEILAGQGMARVDAIRQISITEQTYYRWRKQYGGMGTDQLKELRRLQKENERLRRAVSDLTLDKLILTEPSQLFELIRSHATVLLTPTIVRLFCDADLTNSINTRHSLSSQNLNLP
jgi:transposase-like protein